MTPVTVVGAGFAGCEAAWALARHGIPVTLWEMKPQKFSPAHHSPDFAELICSNSFKARNRLPGCSRRRWSGWAASVSPVPRRQRWLPAGPWRWIGTGSRR